MRKEIHYVNQLDYAFLSYPTTLERGERLKEPYPSVAKAGCGLCCICMMVEGLAGELLTVEQCVELSVTAGANTFGTDMKVLGAAAAGKYGLHMETGSTAGDLLRCLSSGGLAILNAGRTNGVFSNGGHFLLAVRAEEDTVWILDPSRTEEKYAVPDRRAQVTLRGNYVLASVGIVEQECKNREPSFWLFWENAGKKYQFST